MQPNPVRRMCTLGMSSNSEDMVPLHAQDISSCFGIPPGARDAAPLLVCTHVKDTTSPFLLPASDCEQAEATHAGKRQHYRLTLWLFSGSIRHTLHAVQYCKSYKKTG